MYFCTFDNASTEVTVISLLTNALRYKLGRQDGNHYHLRSCSIFGPDLDTD